MEVAKRRARIARPTATRFRTPIPEVERKFTSTSPADARDCDWTDQRLQTRT